MKFDKIMYERFRMVRHSNRTGSHIQCIKINIANTIEHEQRKFDVCWAIARAGHKFITEAIFEGDNGRPDVIDLTNGIIYEILHSETLAEAKKKSKKYPDEFEVRFVSSRDDDWITELVI